LNPDRIIDSRRRYYRRDQEADREAERAIRGTEIVRSVAALAEELLELAESPNEDPDVREAAYDAAEALALATRPVADLTSIYVGYAIALSGRDDDQSARVAALCDGAARNISEDAVERVLDNPDRKSA